MIDSLPAHAFFCREPYHLMQAILFAMEHNEPTDIFLLKGPTLDESKLSLHDTDIITFRRVEENSACVPIARAIANLTRTEDDTAAIRCLYNKECKVHIFPPADRYSFFNRDDIVLHDDGNKSYWRNGTKGVLDVASSCTRQIALSKLPDDYHRKQDWKVRVWDFRATLEKLSEEQRQEIRGFFNVPELNPGEKSLLFVNKAMALPLERLVTVVGYTGDLLRDLQEDGWEVWFKEHPYEGEGVNAIAHNLPPTRIIPGSIPVELLAYTAKTPFTATVSVRCHGLESLPSSLSKTRRNGLTGSASREMGTNREADPTSIYLRGLQKIATTHLSRSDVLKKWFVLPEPPHDSSHDEEEEDVAPPGDSSD